MSTPEFVIDSKGVLQQCLNPGRNVVIPENVIKIGENAFAHCESLIGVTIAKSVTEIGKGAFWCCESLASVSIPESVTEIGESAFYHCGSLTSVSIPPRVTRIEKSAFAHCTSLASAAIPESVTEIGASAFAFCRSLSAVHIPAGVTKIGESAFLSCEGLSSVTIPEGVAEVGWRAFGSCTGLTSISLPECVTRIDKHDIDSCSNLREVRLYGENVRIQEGALPGGAVILAPRTAIAALPQELRQNAVLGFAALLRENAGIPEEIRAENVEYIRGLSGQLYDQALKNPALLALLTQENMIPERALDEMLQKAPKRKNPEIRTLLLEYRHRNFEPQDPLEELGLDSTPKKETVAEIKEKWKYTKEADGTMTLTGYIGEETTVVLPAQIGKSAVAAMGSSAFVRDRTVEHVIIPDGIKAIGRSKNALSRSVFERCDALKLVYIPQSLTEISEGPAEECPALAQWIIAPQNTEFYAENGALIQQRGKILLSWPAASGQAVIPDGIRKIGRSAFFHCQGLTGAVIPDSVAEIGGDAFWSTGLTSVDIPSSVAEIGANAFGNCGQLTGVTMEKGVARIGESAFSGCGSLTAAVIPDSVTEIGQGAFFYCKKLADVTIPKLVTEIRDNTFHSCEGLTSVTIPSGVARIGESAFIHCTGLVSVTILQGVAEIGGAAFFNCARLTDVTIPSSVERISVDAFRQCPNLTIHGTDGSAAMEYAREQKIRFQALYSQRS